LQSSLTENRILKRQNEFFYRLVKINGQCAFQAPDEGPEKFPPKKTTKAHLAQLAIKISKLPMRPPNN
jgi:hypothetical protein